MAQWAEGLVRMRRVEAASPGTPGLREAHTSGRWLWGDGDPPATLGRPRLSS